MSDQNIIHPLYEGDGPGAEPLANFYPAQAHIDNYAATLKDIQSRVSEDGLANQGLIAKGQLPVVEVALHQKAPPDAKAFATGNPNLEFKWDGQGNLSTATFNYGNGATETATFKDGKLSSDRVATPDNDLVFQYDANRHVQHLEIDVHIKADKAHKIEADQHVEKYDLAADGTMTHGLMLGGDPKEIFNQPNSHRFITRQDNGDVYDYNYTANGTFLYGNITESHVNYGVQNVGNGIGILIKEHTI